MDGPLKSVGLSLCKCVLSIVCGGSGGFLAFLSNKYDPSRAWVDQKDHLRIRL